MMTTSEHWNAYQQDRNHAAAAIRHALEACHAVTQDHATISTAQGRAALGAMNAVRVALAIIDNETSNPIE
jgi:hypothetical protein